MNGNLGERANERKKERRTKRREFKRKDELIIEWEKPPPCEGTWIDQSPMLEIKCWAIDFALLSLKVLVHISHSISEQTNHMNLKRRWMAERDKIRLQLFQCKFRTK